MSVDKKDFYGKEVAEAIKKACDSLGVGQEELDIEVVETGSTGIFGLIRKKAHIRAEIKPEEAGDEDPFEIGLLLDSQPEDEEADAVTDSESVAGDSTVLSEMAATPGDGKDTVVKEVEKTEEISVESLGIVKAELLKLVELMGFSSTLEVEVSGFSVSCTLRGEFEENLTGADGKVLDSLQYILRKIVSRKVPERLRISINVGDFRQKRLEELKVRAVELAAQVKVEGKTQVLPALNPSERRVIHMILQENKDIRSRSVGDGLFKKILIYKPGKGNRPGGRKRGQAKGRPKKTPQSPKKDSES